MRLGTTVLVAFASLSLGAPVSAQRSLRSACVTVADVTGLRPLRGAMVRQASPDAPTGMKVITASDGLACVAGLDSASVRIDAIGYYPVWLALATRGKPVVRLQPIGGGAILPEWGAGQVVAGIAQILRRPEIARDVNVAGALAEIVRQVERAPVALRIANDSAGAPLIGYMDLASDGSRYGELRFRHDSTTITLGLTTMQCAEGCSRERDIALVWRTSADGDAWVPTQVVTRTGDGEIVRTAFDPSLPDTSASVAPPLGPQAAIATIVRGAILDRQGGPLAGIEVFSADGSASTLTDVHGAYRLAVNVARGGMLISTRRLGWAPAFRTLLPQEGQAVEWSPSLASTAVLATQLVQATGLPDALRSFRYADFLARRSRGVGQFFMGEEIWSAVSIGDVVNRARGIRALFSHGSNLTGFRVPSCPVGASAVGVFVNGVDETGLSTLQRLDVGAARGPIAGSDNPSAQALSNYVTSAIVGLEIFIGRTELPADFGDPRYCAVISLWTR